MNIAITGNPYVENQVTILTRGVMTDAKVAKLNNTLKRPVLVANWEKGRPSNVTTNAEVTKEETVKNYDELLSRIGICAVNYTKEAESTGAKKLRVNKIVNTKTSNIYAHVNREDVVSLVETPKEEVQTLINQINVVEPKEEVEIAKPHEEDAHGRHERTGEIPVEDVHEAIANTNPGNPIGMPSRVERNATLNKDESITKQETKAGDMDLYNNLLHNVKGEDVSRQLQGAREELLNEREESKKLAEQYGKAVRELEELKEEIANKRKMKIQQEKRELSETLNNIETLKRENLERTSDLSSIQAEIARLKSERQAMESSIYSESRSFGRAA